MLQRALHARLAQKAHIRGTSLGVQPAVVEVILGGRPGTRARGAVAVTLRTADGRLVNAPMQVTTAAPPTGVGITAIEPQCT